MIAYYLQHRVKEETWSRHGEDHGEDMEKTWSRHGVDMVTECCGFTPYSSKTSSWTLSFTQQQQQQQLQKQSNQRNMLSPVIEIWHWFVLFTISPPHLPSLPLPSPPLHPLPTPLLS